MNLSQYSTIVFDCDGVVLDSNRIKTEAFRIAAQPYGTAAADALVDHHVTNGGVSRYNKFATFLEVILPEYAPNAVAGQDGPGVEQLLAVYANAVRSGLMTCAVADGLEALRASTTQARWLIVSGGDERELRQIFSERGIAQLFDGGIFGSPDSKDTILARELTAGIIHNPAIFLGDSLYDYQVAKRVGMDFIFMSGWTEFANWKEFTANHGIPSASHLVNLLKT
jgi:phosphoglycolate phosphatase-like HAD superfamily hydrolase